MSLDVPPTMSTLAAMGDLTDNEKPTRTDSPPATASVSSSSDAGSNTDAATPTTTDLKSKTVRELLEPRFWSIVVLGALAATAPLVISCTAFVVAIHRLFFHVKPVPWNGKTAIVSGGKMTKSFLMIKQLKAQGCRVVLVETSKCAASRPPPPHAALAPSCLPLLRATTVPRQVLDGGVALLEVR